MKRILIKGLAVLFVVGGLVAVMWPVPDWRLYDENWKPLAMTEAEAWCAGFNFGQTLDNKEDPDLMQQCIEEHDELDNEIHGVASIVKKGCMGFEAVTAYPVAECEGIFESAGLWWLATGGYTWEWNDSNPRPQVVQSNIVDAPRDGRTDSGRSDMGRLGHDD